MPIFLTLLGILKYFSLGSFLYILGVKHEYIKNNLPLTFETVFSFLLGISLVSILLHLGLFFNLLTAAYVVVWILFLATLPIVTRRAITLYSKLSHEKKIAGIVVKIAFFVQVTILSLQPVIANDARGIWLVKAKALFIGKPEFLSYLQNQLYAYTHADYPITIPLLYVDLMKPLGYFWEPASGVLAFTFFTILAIGLFGALRYFTKISIWQALFITCALLFTTEYLRQGWSGLSDVPLSLYFFGVVLSGMFAKKNIPNTFILPITFAAISATVKNEGLTFFALTILLVGYLLASQINWKKLRETQVSRYFILAICTLITLLPLIVWKFYGATLHLQNDVVGNPNMNQLLSRIPVMVDQILPRIFDGYRFGILFTPALLLLLLPSQKKDLNIWGLLILGQAFVYLLIYFITPHDLKWHISTSLSRLVLHLLPSVYLLALAHRSTAMSYN